MYTVVYSCEIVYSHTSVYSCTVYVFSVYLEMLNRQQNRLQLVVFDVECFVVNEDSTECMMQDAADSDSVSLRGSIWIVRDETSTYWVNVSICILFLYAHRTVVTEEGRAVT